jgi:hypothetical protein
MQELYGVLGTGTASKKVIWASLDDLGTKVEYVIPWYGKPSEGLEHVYDWMIDNEATFTVVSSGRTPKALRDVALDFINDVEGINDEIVHRLKNREVSGIATILWDQENEQYSHSLATACIESGLPTLELTNGLVPLIFDDEDETAQEDQVEEATEVSETPVDDEHEFSREEIDSMPAAMVKKLAKDKGFDAKTKDEAIQALFPGEVQEEQQGSDPVWVVKVTVEYSDGTITVL